MNKGFIHKVWHKCRSKINLFKILDLSSLVGIVPGAKPRICFPFFWDEKNIECVLAVSNFY